ncbi:MAG: DUF4956 domain-containing protein [Bacilli bacterium]|nr:DUF4956 domain-containing protein [Bacilli bacterium]
MFNNIIGSSLDIKSFVICIITSLILGFFVSILHMKTSRYSKNFVVTLTVLPTLVATVILMVNGNLGTSVAILGTFGLIRFRSVPGNSREIMNVFFAMAIGLAVGTGYIAFAILITLIITIFSYLLHVLNFGENKSDNKILKVVIPENLNYTNIFDDIFEKYLKDYKLEQVKTINMGSMFEITYLVSLKDINDEKDLLDKIRCRNGNLKILIMNNNNDQEL